jgi:hypothetical protein
VEGRVWGEGRMNPQIPQITPIKKQKKLTVGQKKLFAYLWNLRNLRIFRLDTKSGGKAE